jgi:hypothetical protein
MDLLIILGTKDSHQRSDGDARQSFGEGNLEGHQTRLLFVLAADHRILRARVQFRSAGNVSEVTRPVVVFVTRNMYLYHFQSWHITDS